MTKKLQLTQTAIEEIKEGKLSNIELAEKYGVKVGTITTTQTRLRQMGFKIPYQNRKYE
jgi:transposase